MLVTLRSKIKLHLYSRNNDSAISLTIAPLPYPLKSREKRQRPDMFIGIFFSLTVTLGLCLFVSVFLIYPLIERITNAKQVQLMTGVAPGIFWTANLIWDFGIYAVGAVLGVVGAIAIDDSYLFTTEGAAGN